ncbi:MaoC family dehydratase [Rhodococcus qingshengii]|uniref:MaoC family dehydratase n=1 Tax=Rhodococcus qingshengii TaxID=334542 RepID=UPI0024B8D7BF|nr:MaoC family dehydratase [Rhodococcus qingshengii]MDJ0490915.1 MaoC family dehydratase [Rhodococcus qingshengii]
MATVEFVDELHQLDGEDLGYSSWIAITQDRVDLFADATEDHQWIHVDVQRATDESPFGGPIAHGYLTLSLLSAMFAQLLTVQKASMAVNYGLNKVRFPAPVPVGSNVRLQGKVIRVEEVANGVQVVINITVYCDASAKPVCVAECVFIYTR